MHNTERHTSFYWKFLFFALLSSALILTLHPSDSQNTDSSSADSAIEVTADADGNYIKWVDFTVSYDALCSAYELDVASHETDHPLNWIELLAYAAAKSGGTFDKKSITVMQKLADELSDNTITMDTLTKDLTYYPYYLEAYQAVLGGMVGDYEAETVSESGETIWTSRYGLKAFSPIAYGFDYNDYDDFDSSRSYGYQRPHLGHDMMGQIGTPI